MSFKSEIDITDMENNTSENNIFISKERYEELLGIEGLLFALRSFGVDNWEGYDEAINYHKYRMGKL